jgi:purine-binding chemotaxis protein CheW
MEACPHRRLFMLKDHNGTISDRSDSYSASGDLLLVTFLLGNASFGIDAQLVQEVVNVGDITHVHHAPAHVVGIRNLRGRIVTVVDMAVLLELGYITMGTESKLLIMEWQNEPVGFLVDVVTEAITAAAGTITAPPANLHARQRRNLRGVYQDGEHLIGVLNPDALFHQEGVTDQGALMKGEKT